MANSKRLSQSMTESWKDAFAPTHISPSADDVEQWLAAWKAVFVRDLIDCRIVSVESETSVEEACDLLLAEDVPCIAVKSRNGSDTDGRFHGLFDYADVNAFLTLAATRHTSLVEDLPGQGRVNEIVAAAKAGRVPVHLVSNLSEKNPIETLPYDASLIAALAIFARGAHRTLIRSPDNPDEFIGTVSDRSLLAWFRSYARATPSFNKYLSNPIRSLSLPSLNLNATVISAASSASVLDAMKLMSEEGVSSIAVVDEHSGDLLSAVSVTDVGKIVVPSQSNQILTNSLLHFIAQIKQPHGSTDGADAYPVYSVVPLSLLSYTIDKLLATNAHRVFVTRDSTSPGMSPGSAGNLTGIVSTVDILSLFARVAKVPGVDPAQMRRHRRASSASSQSSFSEAGFSIRSRSNSKTNVFHGPGGITSTSAVGTISVLDSSRPGSGMLDPASLQKKENRKSNRVAKDT
jgi:CBS domain-containing protein